MGQYFHDGRETSRAHYGRMYPQPAKTHDRLTAEQRAEIEKRLDDAVAGGLTSIMMRIEELRALISAAEQCGA